MNKTFKVYAVHKEFKVLVVYLFPSAREASEATGEEVMFHSHVWSYSRLLLPSLPYRVTSWPTLVDHIVHVFQYEVTAFFVGFLVAGYRSPLLPTLCLVVVS